MLMRMLAAVLAFAAMGAFAQVDHAHKAWDDLLDKSKRIFNVTVITEI